MNSVSALRGHIGTDSACEALTVPIKEEGIYSRHHEMSPPLAGGGGRREA